MCELLVFLVGDEYFVPKIVFLSFQTSFSIYFPVFTSSFLQVTNTVNLHDHLTDYLTPSFMKNLKIKQVFAQHVLLKRLNATKHV